MQYSTNFLSNSIPPKHELPYLLFTSIKESSILFTDISKLSLPKSKIKKYFSLLFFSLIVLYEKVYAAADVLFKILKILRPESVHAFFNLFFISNFNFKKI